MIRALLSGLVAVVLLGGLAWVTLTSPRPRVVLIAGGASSYWELLAAGARAAARAGDVDLQVVLPPSKSSVRCQTETLASIDPAHADGLLFCPVDATAHKAQINALAEKMVVMTCRLEAPGANHVGHIGPGYYSSGSVCAGLVRNLLPEGGKIAVLTDDCQRLRGERFNGLEAGLRLGSKAGSASLWTIATLGSKGRDAERCGAPLQRLLGDDPEIACIVCFGPRQCQTAVKALSAEGRRIKIVAFDPTAATLDDLAAGRIDAALAVDPFELGRRAVARMGALLRGNWAQVPLAGVGSDLVRPEIVTRDTLAAYRARHDAQFKLAAN
jgi:ribose transport system substrate-binding protein